MKLSLADLGSAAHRCGKLTYKQYLKLFVFGVTLILKRSWSVCRRFTDQSLKLKLLKFKIHEQAKQMDKYFLLFWRSIRFNCFKRSAYGCSPLL